MNFDGAADITGSLCAWSPNGLYLAVVASRSRLVVRDSKTLDVIFSEICSSGSTGARTTLLTGEESKIDKIGFSPDSVFVYACSFKAGVSHIFQVQESDQRWKAKITEGVAGLSDIIFTPDSRHLVAFSELNIKLTLWSFVQKKVRYIKYPKNRACVQFSPDGKYLSVVERREGRDCVSLFSCSDWGIAKHFETDCPDCAELSWSPRADSICIWSTPLEFSCYVYTLDGQCIFSFTPTTLGLGIATVAWSPCGNLLALAGCDGKTRLFNTINWSLVTELSAVSNTIANTKTLVYEEVEVPVKDVDLRLAKEFLSKRPETEYRIIDKRPVHILATEKAKSPENKTGKSFKITDLKFRPDGHYLAVRTEGVPSTVYIYSIQDLRLDSALVQRYPVTNMTWGPVQPYSDCLTILTTDGSIHAWSSNGAVCLTLPVQDSDLVVDQIQWNPRGKALALATKEKIICCRVGMNQDDDSQ